MRILVVCQYYYPEQFRIIDICEQLVQNGHSVTVLTGLPNYPDGVIPKEYRYGRRRKENRNGVEIQRCFEIGRKNNIWGIAFNYTSFMFSASFKAMFLKKAYDAIFVYQLSPVFMTLPAVVMKKRTKKTLFLYCCDIWPESAKIYISNDKNIAYRLIHRFSNYLYSQCDTIAVTSKPFVEYFNKTHFVSKSKIVYIPQHAEEILTEESNSSDKETIDFVFTGNIGVLQDIDTIIDAVERIKEIPNFRVHFVGDGSYLETSKNIVDKRGLQQKIVFHGRHPIEKMPEFYNLADACLLTLKNDSMVGLTIPSKLQGYMSAGKTVIGAVDGAACEIINEAQCGVCVKAGDADALAEIMRDFIQNTDKYKKCGENGKRYFFSNFTKEIYMEKLEKELNKLVNKNESFQ